MGDESEEGASTWVDGDLTEGFAQMCEGFYNSSMTEFRRQRGRRRETIVSTNESLIV